MLQPAASSSVTLSGPLSAASPATAGTPHLQRAQVTFTGGLLQVQANNASLNAILHEITRTTGMKITGSVSEQRVFGDYGPAAPATVLATLLDGTGTNMLLRESADAAPTELILTPRTGVAAPPSAFAPSSDDAPNPPDAAAQGGALSPPVPQPGPFPLRRTTGTAPNGIPGQPNGTAVNGINLNSPGTSSSSAEFNPNTSGPSVTPAPGTTTDALGASAASSVLNPSTGANPANAVSPDTLRTPEQIYQQLEQLRRQAQQQTPPQ